MEAEACFGDKFIVNPDSTVPNLQAARASPQGGGSQRALGCAKRSPIRGQRFDTFQELAIATSAHLNFRAPQPCQFLAALTLNSCRNPVPSICHIKTCEIDRRHRAPV